MEVEDPDDGDNITYSISTLTSNIADPLTIDRYTGEIRFAVDYDVDNGIMSGKILANITATDAENAVGSTLIAVTIQDINDNGPSFPFDYYTLFVPQNLSVRSTVLNLSTVDPDRVSAFSDLELATLFYMFCLGGSEDDDYDDGDYYNYDGSGDYPDNDVSRYYFDVTHDGRAVYLTKSLDTNKTQTCHVFAFDPATKMGGNSTIVIHIIPNDAGVTLSASASTATKNSTTTGGTETPSSCCCSELEKLDWVVPLTPILCTIVLVILLILTRYSV